MLGPCRIHQRFTFLRHNSAMSKIKVLFLCTGNSCRSQMAEAWLRHFGGDEFEAFSAGTDPKPIHPLTFKVMLEDGITLEGQRHKHLDEFLGREFFSYIITVCDAARDTCPTVWPGVHEVLHLSFEDPAAFVGDEFSTLQKFREVRDAIEDGVRELIQRLRERLRAEEEAADLAPEAGGAAGRSG